MFAGAACLATLLIGATSVGHNEQSGFEFMEVNSHHFASGQATERTGLMRKERDDHDGLDVKRDGRVNLLTVDGDPKICGVHTAATCAQCHTSAQALGQSGTEESSCHGECEWDGTDCIDRAAPAPGPAVGVTWGGYTFATRAHECLEYGATTAANVESLFETWSGTMSRLTLTGGTTIEAGVPTETNSGLRIYKTACANATATTIGGETTIPAGSSAIEVIFGIVETCTGDCSAFMVTVKHGSTDAKLYRWCFNREGHSPEIDCDETEDVANDKWLKRSFDLSNISDSGGSLKLALEIYTSGDYRFLAALPGQVGVGGRAMALVDTLLFTPYSDPAVDNTVASSAADCRESLQDVCPLNAWCNDKYRCHGGFCAEGSTRCNMQRNCPDDSDEVGCQVAGGFESEFWTSHARDLRNNVTIAGLSNADSRRMMDVIDYDHHDFWTKAHAKDYFAARWRGNFTLGVSGRYAWSMVNSGEAVLYIKGQGDLAWVDRNESGINGAGQQSSWVNFYAGTYELTLEFIHRTGNPFITLAYVGENTQATLVPISSSEVTANLRGPHCDTMACANGLSPKTQAATLLCDSVPCTAATDTNACCTRKYKAITAGDYRSCAIDLSGKPVCWGDTWAGHNEQWKKNVESDGTPTTFRSLSTRGQYTCGVKESDSTVVCWKPDQATNTLDFSANSFMTNISVGEKHVCGMRTSRMVGCTGEQLSNGAFAYNPNSEAFPTDIPFDKVASGKDFWCGVRSTDKGVFCMGQNGLGQATPDPAIASPSEQSPPANGVIDIDAGDNHACVIVNDPLTAGGTVHCWGGNSLAQATPPTAVGFTKVAAGGKHSCALKADGEAHCWGANADGQSTVPEYKTAAGTTEKGKFSEIAAGAAHTCGIREEDQEVVCWGSNFKPEAGGVMSFVGQSMPPRAETITYG